MWWITTGWLLGRYCDPLLWDILSYWHYEYVTSCAINSLVCCTLVVVLWYQTCIYLCTPHILTCTIYIQNRPTLLPKPNVCVCMPPNVHYIYSIKGTFWSLPQIKAWPTPLFINKCLLFSSFKWTHTSI
jgi:hypothetical protein